MIPQWCESPAPEYGNTWTSTVFFFVAHALFVHHNISHRIIAAIYITGCGSCLFHYYGNRITQVIDETGILLIQYSIYEFVDLKHRNFLFFIGLVFTLLYPDYNCIILLFGSWIVYLQKHQQVHISTTTKILATLATITWVLDFLWCPLVAYPLTWHAIWHLFAGATAYYGVLDLYPRHH